MMLKHDSTKFISFNCEGAFRNKDCIKYILERLRPDLMYLPETWLLDNKIDVIEKLDKSYITISKAGIDIEKDIPVGMPSGGTIIMYKNIYISMSILFHIKANDCIM